MLYHLHDTLHAALAPTRLTMQWTGGVLGNPFVPASHTWSGRATAAWAEVVESFMRPRGKPAWDIRVGRGAEQVLFEQEADRTAFCRLLRFRQDGATGPAVLLVAPMSGHFATLLRETDAVARSVPSRPNSAMPFRRHHASSSPSRRSAGTTRRRPGS